MPGQNPLLFQGAQTGSFPSFAEGLLPLLRGGGAFQAPQRQDIFGQINMLGPNVPFLRALRGGFTEQDPFGQVR